MYQIYNYQSLGTVPINLGLRPSTKKEENWAYKHVTLRLNSEDQIQINQSLGIKSQNLKVVAHVVFTDNTITIQIAAQLRKDEYQVIYSGYYERNTKNLISEDSESFSTKVESEEVYTLAGKHARLNELLYLATFYNPNQSNNKVLRKILESLEFLQKFILDFNAAYAYGGFALTSLCFSTVSAENFTRDLAVGFAVVAGILSSVAKIIHTVATDKEFRNKENSEIALRIGGLVLLNLTMTLSVAYFSHALFVGLGSSALGTASGALICMLIAGVAANHIYDKHIEDVIPVVKDFLSSSQSYRI